MDTTNDFLVGVGADDIVVMLPVRGRISKEKALRLAAWIVALSDPDEFKKVLEAVQNT